MLLNWYTQIGHWFQQVQDFENILKEFIKSKWELFFYDGIHNLIE